MCHGIVRKKDIYYYEKIQEFIQKLIHDFLRLISSINFFNFNMMDINDIVIRHPSGILGEKQISTLKKVNTSVNTSMNTTIKGFDIMKSNTPLTYKQRPLEVVDIGPYGKGYGHDEFTGDCKQAYQQCLMWIATDNIEYANKCKSIIWDWCKTCKVFTGSNAPLECAWGIPLFVRSVELLKYYSKVLSKNDLACFDLFIDKIMLPNLLDRYNEIKKWNNNWIFSLQEAIIQIALYKNDKAKVIEMVKDYKVCLKTCVLDCGCNTENKRDMIHCQFQVASQIQIPEMIWHQGINIYNPIIMRTMEYQAYILNGGVPGELKKEDLKDVWFLPSAWDIGYNHWVNRMKQKMPNTDKLLTKPKTRPENLSFNWGPAWIHYNSG
jgi:hypothetical protein